MTAAAAGAAKPCPKCGNPSTDFLRIDAGMRLRIKETLGEGEEIPTEVCPSCFKNISQNVSRGAKLRADQQTREQNKLILWRSRVNLVKQGRKLMANKAYSEAAVSFEKYLRVLEVVYDKKPGELTPELFKDSARTKEITVVASVLWDLVRIYDTTPRYGDRMRKACDKLIAFIQLTPIQSEILRKARQFEGTAKNSSVVKDFIKRADKGGGRCFIATAAFESSDAYEVRILRRFRDDVLIDYAIGRFFIRAYNFTSPPIARVLDRSKSLRSPIRMALKTVAAWLDKTFNLHTPKDV